MPGYLSEIEGNVDIVEHEKTGLIFEVKNQGQLIQRLEQALENPTVIQGYAKNLRTKIEQSFDQPIVHRQLRGRYFEILEKP